VNHFWHAQVPFPRHATSQSFNRLCFLPPPPLTLLHGTSIRRWVSQVVYWRKIFPCGSMTRQSFLFPTAERLCSRPSLHSRATQKVDFRKYPSPRAPSDCIPQTEAILFFLIFFHGARYDLPRRLDGLILDFRASRQKKMNGPLVRCRG